MFSGYLTGDFVVDPNFQVMSSEFSPEMRDENGWHLPAIQEPPKKLELLNKEMPPLLHNALLT